MNKKTFIAIATIFSCLLPIFAQNNISTKTILTVKKINFKPNKDLVFDLQSVEVVDEKGDVFVFEGFANKWFENADVKEDIGINGSFEQNFSTGEISPSNDMKLLIKFIVNGKTYPVSIGVGNEFSVQKTKNGRYVLRPIETIKLSPPPSTGNE